MKPFTIIIIVVIIGLATALWYFQSKQFPIPTGETISLNNESPENKLEQIMQSQREILITDGIKHSIVLEEILAGGPAKDGIPSIDNPAFVSAKEATFLERNDPGVGLTVKGESRFYPYRILVWHEIVNDTIQGEPVLVTYCPLCATGIVFDRKVGGVVEEFGTSGKLWRSNLLMYNRAEKESDESLWSQVLGEAVLGAHTGERLSIIPSDIIRWSDWKKIHQDTKVLSANTGVTRDYGRDPYEDYYTSESVSFGASFNDTRLHPKALVHGIMIDGQYKAYDDEALRKAGGSLTETFAGKNIVVTRTKFGEVRFKADEAPLSSISGFWFSWLAVHPETELFK